MTKERSPWTLEGVKDLCAMIESANASSDLVVEPKSALSRDKLVERFAGYPELEVFRWTLIDPVREIGSLNPFSSNGDEWNGPSGHIGEHCLAVAAVAAELARSVARFVVPPGEEGSFVRRMESLGLLHDSLKRLEISWHISKRSGRGDRLRAANSREAAVAWLGESGGHDWLLNGCRDASERASDEMIMYLSEPTVGQAVRLRGGYWPEKLLLLADAMTATNFSQHGMSATTQVLTPIERIQYTKLLSRSYDIPPAFVVHMGTSVQRASGVNGEEHLADAQTFLVWFAHAIAEEIAVLLNLPDVPSAAEQVKHIVSQRLANLSRGEGSESSAGAN